ncbi:MAG: DUF4440 domain-containing protein [Pseudomonadota bacterium]
MNRRTALLTLGLAGAGSLPAAPALAAGPAAARAVVTRFHAAMKAGDAAAVADLLDDAAVIYEQGGVEATKAEYVDAHLPGDIAYSAALETRVLAEHGFGHGGLQVLLRETRTTGRFNDKPVDRLGTETMVLQGARGRWRIVHIHWSSRAAPV